VRLLRRRRGAPRPPLPEEIGLVLTLHGVVERIDDPVVQVNHLDLASFERLIERVRSERSVVTLDEIAAALAGDAPLPSNALAITFDDGYRSVAELVDPLLQRHGLPYAVFVPPGLIGSRARVPTYVMRAALELTTESEVTLTGRRPLSLRTPDEREEAAGQAAKALRALSRHGAEAVAAELRGLLSEAEWEEADRRFASEELMTWDEIRALSGRGVAIGSHTSDHVVLHGQQSTEEIGHQVARSKAAIEERLGTGCRHFSYPHGTPGDVCRAAVEAVAAAGYSTGLMNVGGPVRAGMASQLLPRMPVASGSPDEALNERRQLSHSKWFAEITRELG
jgi:peptidoglycan/xylan/chitin deacetylase (PgdA/CDA1 family)